MLRFFSVSVAVSVTLLVLAVAAAASVLLGVMTVASCLLGDPVAYEWVVGPVRHAWSCGVAP